jgi:hypothetical protein
MDKLQNKGLELELFQTEFVGPKSSFIKVQFFLKNNLNEDIRNIQVCFGKKGEHFNKYDTYKPLPANSKQECFTMILLPDKVADIYIFADLKVNEVRIEEKS